MTRLPRSSALWIGALVVIAMALLPFWVSAYILSVLTASYYFGVFAMAWDLLFGFAGEVNFGPTFLIGLGAYTAGIVDNQYGLPIVVCVALGALAAIAGAAPARTLFRPRHPRRGAPPAERDRHLRRRHRRRDRHDRPGRALDRRQRQLLVRARLPRRLRHHSLRPFALGDRAHSPGERPGRGRGAGPRLQRDEAQDRRLLHQRRLLRDRGRYAGLLRRRRLGRHDHRYRHRRSGHHRGRAGRAPHHPRRRARRRGPHPRQRGVAAFGPAQHLRRLGRGARRDPLLPGRPPRLCAARGRARMTGPSRLAVSGLTKRFGGLVAVKDIAFNIAGGEILGLIGPNGSGKSTVMKLIMGIERPNAGTVKLDGVDIAGWPPHRIARAGIGIVFQHSRPLHRQTVLENIKLALLPDSLLRLAAAPGVDERARAIAERVGLGAVMHRHPSTLPFADLRRMEMAKAIARDPKVVLVDEPFAAITGAEMRAFSELIHGFREEGRAVLLVDHNVKSVAALVDRVLAMYLGEHVAEGSADEVMQNETVRRVYLGGKIEAVERRLETAGASPPLLDVADLSVFYGKAQALEKVSIHVREGEFVSVVGLNGAGKTTLFNAISGLVPYAGAIRFDGCDLRRVTAGGVARAGLVQCPETRELFGDMTVRENLDLGGHRLTAARRAHQLDFLFELFPILRKRQTQVARTLSGGEQQMLAIARALMMEPKLLILDEPTLGLAPVILDQLSKAMHLLRKTTPITVLLGEQNVTFALPHADRVYLLEHARIIWEGDPARFASEMGTGYL